MEYRRGRIAQEYRRRGRVARLARFRARSHSRNAYGGGQTESFPLSEVSSHYEPSESCETNIRKRPVCPRVPACGYRCRDLQGEMSDEGRGGGGGQDQGASSLVKNRSAEGPTLSCLRQAGNNQRRKGGASGPRMLSVLMYTLGERQALTSYSVFRVR